MNHDEPGGPRPRLNSEPDAFSASHSGLRDNQPTRKLQLLYVGSLQLGVFEDEIATIVDWREPTPLPHAPASVLGVVSVQGRMLTVLDLGALLSETADIDGSSRSYIVALRGDEQLALTIENKGEILELAAQDIKPPSGTAGSIVLGDLHRAGQPISVLDVKNLFRAAIRGRERRRRRF
jgi:purine-binding chemotaxis protein CheW